MHVQQNMKKRLTQFALSKFTLGMV